MVVIKPIQCVARGRNRIGSYQAQVPILQLLAIQPTVEISVQKLNYCLLALALSGCVAGAPQESADLRDVPTKTVRYAELNLNTADGARALFRRIKFAAAEVCEPLDGRALAQHVIWQKCYERALADAVSQVNQPRVTALYRGVANRG